MGSENNKIDITGHVSSDYELSHNVFDRNFYSFYVNVARRSHAIDTLSVKVPEYVISSAGVTVGKKVRIKGEIRSYNKYSESENKSKHLIDVYAKSIVSADNAEYAHNNSVYLDGYLCKPPVYRTTPYNREITDIVLSVKRAEGRRDYIPCIIWGENARVIGKLEKWDNLRLWGRMQSRQYHKFNINGDETERMEKTAYEVSSYKIEPY